MAAKHIYLMSLAASGKSSFANKHKQYKGYTVVDYAKHLPGRNPLAVALLYVCRPFPALQLKLRQNQRLNSIGPHYYFDAVADFMQHHEEPMVIMGRRLPPRVLNNEAFSFAALGIVMIPEEQHRRQCESRRQELRNPLPFFDHWTTNFDKVKKLRQDMRAYADAHGIGVFDSFASAIDSLSEDPAAQSSEAG